MINLSITRIYDALPLAESMEDVEMDGFKQKMSEFKTVQRKINIRSPRQMSIDATGLCYHYVIAKNTLFMAMTESSFPKVQIFSFLDEAATAFFSEYNEMQVSSANRPYAFVQFDTQIQQIKRKYVYSRANDPGSASKIDKINMKVIDMQNVMRRNVHDLLERGNKLSDLGDMASDLRYSSEKYLRDTKYVNLMEKYRKYVPLAIVLAVALVLLLTKVYLL